MVSASKPCRTQDSSPSWHRQFLTMLPGIERYAAIAFRDCDPEAREDAVHEVVANCLCAFVRLVERGKTEVAYPTALARFAVRQFRTGRRVGGRLNIRDVSSPHCQQAKHVDVCRLYRYDREDEQWRELVVEDRRASPADIAATRIDFAAWLDSLPARDRKIAQTLATGESSQSTARRFHLSEGRISQLRRQFKESWDRFHGEPDRR